MKWIRFCYQFLLDLQPSTEAGNFIFVLIKEGTFVPNLFIFTVICICLLLLLFLVILHIIKHFAIIFHFSISNNIFSQFTLHLINWNTFCALFWLNGFLCEYNIAGGKGEGVYLLSNIIIWYSICLLEYQLFYWHSHSETDSQRDRQNKKILVALSNSKYNFTTWFFLAFSNHAVDIIFCLSRSFSLFPIYVFIIIFNYYFYLP